MQILIRMLIMGYESSFNYEFYDAEIKNLDELNKKVSKLEYGMGDAKITKSSYDGLHSITYSIEMDTYSGKFYDDEDFAELVSKYLAKGYLDLIFTGEDGTIGGFRAYPKKVKHLEAKFAEID